MKRAKILSASAGSGKTFQLTLKYICDIIKRPESYRNILAVTFTNKATEEMKSRILREIHVLASGGHSHYLDKIEDAMHLGEEKIRQYALVARNKILHDFSRFNVLTIDKFFQRILRAFIKELGLDLDYNLEIETELLLDRSAATLINSISTDKDVRHWLFDFAEERFNVGETWDIHKDLCKLGQQLFSETGAKRMKGDISKERLHNLVQLIIQDAERHHQQLKELGGKGMSIMEERGVSPDQFSGKTRSFVYSFYAYAAGDLKVPTATMIKASQDVSAWYGKDAGGNVVCAAELLRPILEEICSIFNRCVEKINTAKLIRNQYRSFALLVDLQRHINSICDDENIMILSETKDVLSKFIDDNNAPFIYEKVGSRYDHYMIDEFQDTSVREWRNMLPLLREALASNSDASVFIVGDIKQSIYRWRGGDWRLLNNVAFEDLGSENTTRDSLKKNYRSLENVVHFNNKMIEQMVDRDNRLLNSTLDAACQGGKISQKVHDAYYDILTHAYSEYQQEVALTGPDKGYVQLCAYDPKVTTSPFIEAIESAIARGYKYRDILILVRRGEDAAKVASQLFAYKEERFTSQNLPGFNILMAESLTLDGCDIVEFINAVLRLAINANNDIDRGLYNRFLGYDIDEVLAAKELEHLARISHLSPMEAFEDIVAHYRLYEHKESIAYLQAMHEQIVVFSTTRASDISQFIKWWEEKGKKVNVAVEMSDDTIEIMTIHKAKGLERDVVIIPYGRWDINPSALNTPIVWAQASDNYQEAAEIGTFPVVYGSSMKDSAYAEEYYRELVMNHVDNINLIYVALTRASKELYVYVSSDINSSSQSENITNTSQLLVGAVKMVCADSEPRMKDGQMSAIYYKYGTPIANAISSYSGDMKQEILLDNYISNTPSVKVRYPAQRYIDEEISCGGDSMKQGILLHSIFEKAHTEHDLRMAIDELKLGCTIDASEALALKQKIDKMLTNPTVKEWFDGSWDEVKCEASILSKNSIRRPDRVMIKGDRIVVVDYKFGDKRHAVYRKQMKEYMRLLGEMNRYKYIDGYVWYVAMEELEKVE